jgi:rod shape-determining protein MreD
VTGRTPHLTILTTCLIALVLSVAPLPTWPGGMMLAFIGGLAIDVFQGSLLGEHALALCFVVYLGIRFNLLMRAKPLFEQSLFVFVVGILGRFQPSR